MCKENHILNKLKHAIWRIRFTSMKCKSSNYCFSLFYFTGSDSKESETEEVYDEFTKFEQELRAECVANIVMPNSFIALFSPPESFELFYLCQAFSIITASEMINDQYNHVIQQGDKYIYHMQISGKIEGETWAYILHAPYHHYFLTW